MTRTERNITKRAILRDRSESKSGLDKSVRKGGAGGHNWGSLEDEGVLEYLAMEDNEDEGLSANEEDGVLAGSVPSVQGAADDGSFNERRVSATAVGVKDQQGQETRQFRAGALKKSADLEDIARTSASAVPVSPGSSSTVAITTDATTGVLP